MIAATSYYHDDRRRYRRRCRRNVTMGLQFAAVAATETVSQSIKFC